MRMSEECPKPERVKVLLEAAELIDGDRNKSYGTPTQNFANIAEMWTTRFRHKLAPGEVFTASDVADAMILLKVARNIAQNKRDNYVDLAGYAGCGYEASLSEQAVTGVVSPSESQTYTLPRSGNGPVALNFNDTNRTVSPDTVAEILGTRKRRPKGM
jgi:hypothetical protein